MDGMQQQRVLADGWGQQSSGSVFCADSSLRYIYESNDQQAPTSQQTISGYNDTNKAQPQVYGKSNPVNNMTVAGKRPRDYSSENPRPNAGVDLFEAEIARACNAIRKQTSSMPHSYRECSVCLSANAYAQISSCGHTFHPNCFLRWFRLNRSCPLCRGVVDKDELEAIMAEIDDEPLQLMREPQQLPRPDEDVATLDDPLLANSDPLMSFLESDFDTDMELAALDDLSATPGGFELSMKQETDGDETMGMELDELVDSGDKQEAMGYAFPPASAMPNYWNVLNQGMAPSIMPPAPAVPPFVPNHQRMVHIAPKPDARTVQHVRSAAATTVRTTEPTFKMPVPQVPQQTHHHHVVRCRNGRCACVKEGGMCGASCRCTSCKNPFLMVKAAGDCFMHNVSKTRDMVVRLQEPVAVPCWLHLRAVQASLRLFVVHEKLLDSERTPRNHCAICKRCCDHRDVHCNDCGRCYFSGVAASLPCPCKEASSHKKRREAAAKDKAEEAEEEAEGECCIM
ncbi:Zinc finger, RING/FYVE/PHD-type [Phytophthora cactorum]|nr:Zinc finger, RING/FYVE/PHD-type [Phytophthora cactorum]